MANPIWQSMKFVIARRELFIRYFILIQYYIFAEHFCVLLASSWWLWIFLTFCSFTSIQHFYTPYLSVGYRCLFHLPPTNTHTHTHSLLSCFSSTHVSALSNIISFHIVNKNISFSYCFFVLRFFDIEKDFKLRNYGGNLSLCGATIQQ